MGRHLVASIAAAFVVNALPSCGPTAPCNVAYDCGANETCWSLDQGITFQCVKAGAEAASAPCTPDETAAPQCGVGLGCFQAICVPWCDPKDASYWCGSAHCVQAQISAVTASTGYACLYGPQ